MILIDTRKTIVINYVCSNKITVKCLPLTKLVQSRFLRLYLSVEKEENPRFYRRDNQSLDTPCVGPFLVS